MDGRKVAVMQYCHDWNISQPDSHSNRLYSVLGLNGEKEKHPKRNWIKKGNMGEQYQRYIISQQYKSFQKQLYRDKPNLFNSTRKPTISEKDFRRFCCKCVGDPTSASCVDIIFDKGLNFIEALNEYLLDSHYSTNSSRIVIYKQDWDKKATSAIVRTVKIANQNGWTFLKKISRLLRLLIS